MHLLWSAWPLKTNWLPSAQSTHLYYKNSEHRHSWNWINTNLRTCYKQPKADIFWKLEIGYIISCPKKLIFWKKLFLKGLIIICTVCIYYRNSKFLLVLFKSSLESWKSMLELQWVIIKMNCEVFLWTILKRLRIMSVSKMKKN